MRVRRLKIAAGPDGIEPPGTEIDLPDDEAQAQIKAGEVTASSPSVAREADLETATTDEAPEAATTRRRRRRSAE